MKIASSSFAPENPIPSRHTCEGPDVSPQLSWSNIPAAAKSLALIVDDPDAPDPAAPTRTWTHWVVYNIPPDVRSLAEAAQHAPKGAEDGVNDWNSTGYRGPCPPIGRHRCYFRLFALSKRLDGLERPTSKQLQAAMAPYVIDRAKLMGTYEKKRR
jgi:hypothetical protein